MKIETKKFISYSLFLSLLTLFVPFALIPIAIFIGYKSVKFIMNKRTFTKRIRTLIAPISISIFSTLIITFFLSSTYILNPIKFENNLQETFSEIGKNKNFAISSHDLEIMQSISPQEYLIFSIAIIFIMLILFTNIGAIFYLIRKK
jgi:hypothetical protein